MRHLRLIGTLSIVLLSACHFGVTGRDLRVGQQPGGVPVMVKTSSGSYDGELMAIQEDGVLISHPKLLFAPFSAIIALRVDTMGNDYSLTSPEIPTSSQLQRLRLVSHFPQGMTPEIRRRLLAQAGQTEIETAK